MLTTTVVSLVLLLETVRLSLLAAILKRLLGLLFLSFSLLLLPFVLKLFFFRLEDGC